MIIFSAVAMTKTKALCRIKNPLAHLSKGQVLGDAESFAREHQLDDIVGFIKKGALLARNPASAHVVPGITDEELAAVGNEASHKWRQPKSLYFTIILCSIGAAVQ